MRKVSKELHIRKSKAKKSNFDSVKNNSLIELYGKNKEIIDKFSEFFEKSQLDYDISEKDVIGVIKNKKSFLSVPVSVFKNRLSPLEAVVQFLRESKYSLKEISKLLNRSNKTIWTTYNNAVKKHVEISVDSDIFIPLSVISNRKLSVLENICVYMKEKFSLSFAKISRIIGKNKNTIWTCYNRARKKRETNE